MTARRSQTHPLFYQLVQRHFDLARTTETGLLHMEHARQQAASNQDWEAGFTTGLPGLPN